jgi:hypothetical protein
MKFFKTQKKFFTVILFTCDGNLAEPEFTRRRSALKPSVQGMHTMTVHPFGNIFAADYK